MSYAPGGGGRGVAEEREVVEEGGGREREVKESLWSTRDKIVRKLHEDYMLM